MMNTFTPTDDFFSSFKMGTVIVSMDRLVGILGPGCGPQDGSVNVWNGVLTVNVGTADVESASVSCWEWNGGISIWAEKYHFLIEWKKLLTG